MKTKVQTCPGQMLGRVTCRMPHHSPRARNTLDQEDVVARESEVGLQAVVSLVRCFSCVEGSDSRRSWDRSSC